MEVDEKSLGAAFSAFTKPVEPTPETPTQEEENTEPASEAVDEITLPETITKPVIETNPETEADEDYIKAFAEKLGYTGEIEGDDFDTLTKIAETQINSYKEKAEFYEANETIKGLAEHLKAGGTVDEYFSTPQETSQFQEIAFEADDVEGREELLNYFFQGIKGMDAEDAEALINGYKEKGTFNSQADKALSLLKEDEVKQNTLIRAQKEQELATRKETREKFFGEMSKGFDEGLKGIVVDKGVYNKAKELSLPNKQGQFGIVEIANKLTATQQAALNVFVTALAEGKKFEYNPTAAVTSTTKAKPIAQILNKNKPAGSNEAVKGLADINKLFSNRQQLVN